MRMRLYASTGECWNKPRERERGHQKGGVLEKRSSSRMLGSSKLVTLVAAILSLCLMVMLMGQGVQKAQAASLKLDQASFVSVQLSKDAEDKGISISNLNLRYMMYKVANAEQQAGYDAYTFAFIKSDPELLTIDDINKLNANTSAATGANKLGASDYDALAQKVAGVIMENAGTPNAIAATYNVPATPAQEIAAGLYVIVPFGADTVTTPESDTANVLTTTKTTDTKETIYASNAYTATQKLIFKPQLVALPTKDVDQVTGSINSANPGEWIYYPTLTLKPTIEPRKGSLTINKLITTSEYNNENIGNNETTFVFDIKGYTDEAHTNLVYTNVASVVINTKNGNSGSATIGNIPAGLYVVVTETYTGTSYEAVTKDGQTAQIIATDNTLIGDTTASATVGAFVDFENTYKNNGNKGGSVTNTFNNGEGEWTWSKNGVAQGNSSSSSSSSSSSGN